MRLACRRGAALMLVLWIIVILGTIATGVFAATRSTTEVAANYRARAVGRYAAESGVTVAVATLEARLAALADTAARQSYLNRLDRALGASERISIADSRVAVALIDVSSRLDVNAADALSLATLFAYFTDPVAAERAARAVRAAPPLRSVEGLASIPGLQGAWVDDAMRFLTVDGDGTINRNTASDTVLAAAGGELRDEPSRILVVSRGWLQGQALTHEIQAVYAVAGNAVTLVRWRERDL